VKNVAESHAYDGGVLHYTIEVSNLAENGATADIHDVKLGDVIQGTTHGCSGIPTTGGTVTPDSGDDTDPGVLNVGETWVFHCTYTVAHADENGSHNIVNVATATGVDEDGATVGPVSDDATTHITHPAIAVDKSGPNTGQAGDKIGYVLSVTNPGDVGFAESTVTVTDTQCNGDAVALIGKGGDTTPTSLDPGDVWTYSCSVQTAVGDQSVHNTATVGATDVFGKTVTAADSADTTLTQPAQLVLPERIVPGAAKLLGPTGCVARAFNARVRGTKIAKVVFFLDGKKKATITKPNKKGLFQLRVNPKRLRIGIHRLVANITFQSGSGTKPKTIRLSFQRCAKKLAAPRFTG
jgi:hypothetical protein